MSALTKLPATTCVSARNAMEGNGYYNDHSQLQHSTIQYALPLLRRAAESAHIPENPSMMVIADYGSSQGKNSLEPIKAAVSIMRSRMIEPFPIAVVHNDQPPMTSVPCFMSWNQVHRVTGVAPQTCFRMQPVGRFTTDSFPTIRSLWVGRPGPFNG